MPTRTTSEQAGLSKIVERQMRNWEIAREQHIEPDAAVPGQVVAPFVAISRTLGSGGRAVALQLGEKLGWPVFDREILLAMAGDNAMRRRLYEHLDERDTNWLSETLRWVLQGELRRDDYYYRLTETCLTLARQSSGVFVGRAVDLILPALRGLRVRIDAPIKRRAAVVAERQGISEDEALAQVERIDAERAEFRRRHFGPRANDLARFDIAIGLAYLSAADAVELICLALQRRGIHPAATRS